MDEELVIVSSTKDLGITVSKDLKTCGLHTLLKWLQNLTECWDV